MFTHTCLLVITITGSSPVYKCILSIWWLIQRLFIYTHRVMANVLHIYKSIYTCTVVYWNNAVLTKYMYLSIFTKKYVNVSITVFTKYTVHV